MGNRRSDNALSADHRSWIIEQMLVVVGKRGGPVNMLVLCVSPAPLKGRNLHTKCTWVCQTHGSNSHCLIMA